MLIPPPKLKPGRQRTVTAKAWISRASAGGVFQSKVSLGDGVVHVLSTKTRRRDKALCFNRCHLLHRLKSSSGEGQVACGECDPPSLLFV